MTGAEWGVKNAETGQVADESNDYTGGSSAYSWLTMCCASISRCTTSTHSLIFSSL